MKKVIFLSVSLIWTIGCFAQTSNPPALPQSELPQQQRDLEKLVKAAFAAAKPRRVDGGEKRDATLIFELPRTAEIIPFLKPYLNSGDSDERSYVILLLDKINSPQTAELLLQGLSDSDHSNAEDAAGILFKNYDRKVLASFPDLENTLHKSLQKGNHSLPAYLLLGYFSGEETEKILAAACLDRTKTDVNQSSNHPKLNKMLVACVLSSGVKRQKNELLLEKFRNNFSVYQSYFFHHVYSFLLDNLELIDDPDVLNILFQKMAFDESDFYPVIDNPRKGGVHDSARFLDSAVNKFAGRLKIEVGFKLVENKKYSQVQINKARRLIIAEIKRLAAAAVSNNSLE